MNRQHKNAIARIFALLITAIGIITVMVASQRPLDEWDEVAYFVFAFQMSAWFYLGITLWIYPFTRRNEE